MAAAPLRPGASLATTALWANGDGTYSYGDEQGNCSLSDGTLSFDGSLGSAAVTNRRMTLDTQVDTPDGSGVQTVRYAYSRMDH